MSGRTVNVLEAKTQLSRLLDEALAGEVIFIARAGKPLVRLVPVHDASERVLGTFQWPDIGDALVAPVDEEELQAWE